MEPKPLIVSLPRFIMLAASVMLVAGLGALAAAQITGRIECFAAFTGGSGTLFLVTLTFLQFSLARMVTRQFSEGEPLQPAWFLIMLGGGCQVVGAVCAQIPSANVERFGSLVGGPLEMLLLAGGFTYVLRLCRRTGITVRYGASDAMFVLVAVAGAYLQVRRPLPDAYAILLALRGPLSIVLLLQATVVRRYMQAMSGGMIAKCWNSLAAAVFLAALGNLALSLGGHEIAWCLALLSATASALGPAWQIEAVQSACGEIGVSRFSPVAISLAALRLLHTSR